MQHTPVKLSVITSSKLIMNYTSKLPHKNIPSIVERRHVMPI